MKNTTMNLPARCSMLSADEMQSIDGGFALNPKAVAAGAAVLAVGVMGLNMLNWFTGKSDSNFIQDSIRFGQNFINGSLEFGQGILNALMGK